MWAQVSGSIKTWIQPKNILKQINRLKIRIHHNTPRNLRQMFNNKRSLRLPNNRPNSSSKKMRPEILLLRQKDENLYKESRIHWCMHISLVLEHTKHQERLFSKMFYRLLNKLTFCDKWKTESMPSMWWGYFRTYFQVWKWKNKKKLWHS